MEEIIKTSLAGVFVFFLLNYAPIFASIRNQVFNWLDIRGGTKNKKGWICRKTKYMLTCIFCITFWFSVVTDFENCIYAPVIAVIINSFFMKAFATKLNG